jgi:hypothetical protein
VAQQSPLGTALVVLCSYFCSRRNRWLSVARLLDLRKEKFGSSLATEFSVLGPRDSGQRP